MSTSTLPLSFAIPLIVKSWPVVNEDSDNDSDVTSAYAGTAIMPVNEMTASAASMRIMLILFYPVFKKHA